MSYYTRFRILHECQGCIFMSPKDKCSIPYCKETSVIILYSHLQHQTLDLRQPSNSPHFGMHMLQICITLQWYTQKAKLQTYSTGCYELKISTYTVPKIDFLLIVVEMTVRKVSKVEVSGGKKKRHKALHVAESYCMRTCH